MAYSISGLFFLGTAKNSYGQQDMVNAVVNSLKTFSRQNLQEKIFIHTDRSLYTCGEIILLSLTISDFKQL